VGVFFLKFSIALIGKTTDRIKKIGRRCKNGTDLLYHHAKYGGDRGSRAGCRRKSVIFFVCLSRFGITKFVITERLWSSAIFKTIMVSLHRGRFVVAHLYSTFSVDPRFDSDGCYGRTDRHLATTWSAAYIQNFPLWANLYQKLPISAILWVV